jgi:hypothetical protein
VLVLGISRGVYYGLDFPFSKLSKAKKLAAQQQLTNIVKQLQKYCETATRKYYETGPKML